MARPPWTLSRRDGLLFSNPCRLFPYPQQVPMSVDSHVSCPPAAARWPGHDRQESGSHLRQLMPPERSAGPRMVLARIAHHDASQGAPAGLDVSWRLRSLSRQPWRGSCSRPPGQSRPALPPRRGNANTKNKCNGMAPSATGTHDCYPIDPIDPHVLPNAPAKHPDCGRQNLHTCPLLGQ